MLKNITIAKRKEVKTATQPTHDLVASDEKYENKTIVGALWTRTTDTGTKFLSGMLSITRTATDGKEYEGYVLITEAEYKLLEEYKNSLVAKKEVSIGGYNGEVANVDEIDF